MKANELMIDDWVEQVQDLVPFAPIKIEEIKRECVIFGNGLCKLNFNEINPIPLTAEILEKNGFIKYNEVSDTPPYDRDEEGNMYYSYKGEQKFWGWWQPDNIFFIPANAMGNIEIKFVHQLQHALRLCNIDKEIEL